MLRWPPPFSTSTGKKAIHVVARDISERKAAELNLKIALEQARTSDMLKTAFLNNLSHEIRTPLNAIVGFSSFITDPDLKVEQRNEFRDIIQSSSDQLLGTIEDIINISTIETGQIEIYENETDVCEMIAKVCSRIRGKAEIKDLKLECSINLDPEDAVVMTDGSKLTHVLFHLADNAIKFTDRER
jgi:signal transduction histidine kinase